MNSINATAQLCKQNHIGLSRHHLLQLAQDGEIPCIQCGNKTLINWDGLMDYLDHHTIEQTTHPQNKIREIEE